MEEKSLHEQLLEAYLAYFEANEKWQRKHSERKYYETQRNLRLIRKLAKQIKDSNTRWYQNRPRPRGGVTK